MMYHAATAKWLREKGYSVAIVGNYSYEKKDTQDLGYRIAILQLAEMLELTEDQIKQLRTEIR